MESKINKNITFFSFFVKMYNFFTINGALLLHLPCIFLLNNLFFNEKHRLEKPSIQLHENPC